MTGAGETLTSMSNRAAALKAEGRFDEAIAIYAQAVAMAPTNAVTEHNLAGAFGDAARHAEAEHHARRAFALGIDAPETWVVLARALQGQRRLDEATAAFGEALKRRPAMADAHRELAQLIWMRTGDIAAAVAHLDRAIAAAPQDPVLKLVKAKALEYAGDDAGSYAVLRATVAGRDDPVLLAMAADAAVRAGTPEAGLVHAESAVRLAPQDPLVQTILAQVCLATGAPDRAARIVEALRAAAPLDQNLIAVQATAWRLTGDPRYRALYDYDAFVSARMLDTPKGWPDLAAYLADVAAALGELHAYHTHPFDQSLRQGSQAPDVLSAEHPALRAFPEAVAGPIAAHIAALGQGADLVRARNTGGWAFQGAWSVRLRPRGFHHDHVHPNGWLSSACYIALPPAVESGGREGWLRFGKPGASTQPPLEAEHWVKPQPGLLALFPSYMWHGTEPFGGEASRLTIAFDLVPA